MKKIVFLLILSVLFAGVCYADPHEYALDPVLFYDSDIIMSVGASTDTIYLDLCGGIEVNSNDIQNMNREEVLRFGSLIIMMSNIYINDPLGCEIAKKLLPWWVSFRE